jgi:hypothetical protein
VQVLLRVSEERLARTVAAKLIDRAHEIANLPECECDVDVNVEWAPPGALADAVDLGGPPARGLPA